MSLAHWRMAATPRNPQHNINAIQPADKILDRGSGEVGTVVSIIHQAVSGTRSFLVTIQPTERSAK